MIAWWHIVLMVIFLPFILGGIISSRRNDALDHAPPKRSARPREDAPLRRHASDDDGALIDGLVTALVLDEMEDKFTDAD